MDDPTDRPFAGTSLASLLATVGLPVLEVIRAPGGLDLPVNGLVMYDSQEDLPVGDGAVLFLVGVSAEDDRLDEILSEARGLGYVAAVMKARGAPHEVMAEVAERVGIALVSAASDISWRELDALLVAALGSGGVSATPGGSTGVSELFPLVNSIAATIGGSVVIEDLEQRILAHSSISGQLIDASRQTSILNRRVPDLPWHREQYLKVLMSPSTVRFPRLRDELPRVAIAIRSGSIPLGTMWAIEGRSGFDSDSERALTDGASMAALHLLRHASRDDADYHVRGDALAGILNGSLSLDEASRRWNFVAGLQASLIGFAPWGHGPKSASLITHMSVALRRHLAALRPDAVSTATSQSLYTLVPDAGETVGLLARRAAQTLTQAVGVPVRAAISSTTRDMTNLRTLADEIDEILRVSRDETMPKVFMLEDVRVRILLNKTSQELINNPRLRNTGLGGVFAQDRKSDTHYAETLKVWLDCFGNWVQAAEVLNLHANTVRYRISRIQDSFGIDLQDSDTRLAVWMELRARLFQ